MKKIHFYFKNLFQKIKNYHYDSFLVLYIILPIFLNLVITCLELKSLFKGIAFVFTNPYVFIVNTLIILMTLSVTLLFKRRVFSLTAVSSVWLILGIANFALLCNRITPFSAYDIQLLESLIDIANKYFSGFQIVMIFALLIAVITLLAILFFKAPKLTRKIHYGRCLIFIAFICGLTFGSIKLGTYSGIMDAQFHELSAAYRKNGFVYCFASSVIDTGVNKPKDYSAESIAQLIAGDNSDISGDTADKTPNIIIVQLESFFDLASLNGIELSEDVIPNFHKYQKADGGLFAVPVIGAGTINSEFEVITGMNIDDFGAGEYPYKTILLDTTCESLAYNLRTYGYTTHFMHNHTGTFYARNEVYANLGFENFMSVEYMQDVERNPMGWAKDAILTDYIMEFLNFTSNQDFVYTISVQGHGTYLVEDGYDKHVTVEACPDGKKDFKTQYEYYANLIHEMDMFVGELVDTLNNFSEDTILVMYGDHLPSLDIETKDLNGRGMYQTDYFIWNNMGIDFNFGDIEANEISALILKELGMSNGIINSFRQNHADDEDFAKSLAALEYDILYGDQLVYGGKNPYVATDIKIGMEEIKIFNVLPNPAKENTFYVIGENFTPYSKAYLNEEKQKTSFIDENTLLVTLEKKTELTSGDSIVVWQSYLSSTEEHIYNFVPMIKEETTSQEDSKSN